MMTNVPNSRRNTRYPGARRGSSSAREAQEDERD
jgi:hypothetical protein